MTALVFLVGEADALGTLNIGHVGDDDFVALFEPVDNLDVIRRRERKKTDEERQSGPTGISIS